MTFESEGRKSVYVNAERSIAFYESNEVRGAYDVVIGNRCHFHIPKDSINDAFDPKVRSSQLMLALDNRPASRGISQTLGSYCISPISFHLELVRMLYGELRKEVQNQDSHSGEREHAE